MRKNNQDRRSCLIRSSSGTPKLYKPQLTTHERYFLMVWRHREQTSEHKTSKHLRHMLESVSSYLSCRLNPHTIRVIDGRD